MYKQVSSGRKGSELRTTRPLSPSSLAVWDPASAPNRVLGLILSHLLNCSGCSSNKILLNVCFGISSSKSQTFFHPNHQFIQSFPSTLKAPSILYPWHRLGSTESRQNTLRPLLQNHLPLVIRNFDNPDCHPSVLSMYLDQIQA